MVERIIGSLGAVAPHWVEAGVRVRVRDGVLVLETVFYTQIRDV